MLLATKAKKFCSKLDGLAFETMEVAYFHTSLCVCRKTIISSIKYTWAAAFFLKKCLFA